MTDLALFRMYCQDEDATDYFFTDAKANQLIADNEHVLLAAAAGLDIMAASASQEARSDSSETLSQNMTQIPRALRESAKALRDQWRLQEDGPEQPFSGMVDSTIAPWETYGDS